MALSPSVTLLMKSSTAHPRSSSQFRSGSANEELLTRRRARASVAIYDVVQLVLHPEPSVTRLRALQAPEAAGSPYRIVVSGGSLAALKASVMAGLGASAFARHVMPDGLTRVSLACCQNSAFGVRARYAESGF